MTKFLTGVATLVCCTNVLSAQELIDDGGFDTPWIDNQDLIDDGDGTVNTMTNIGFEWWGGQAWDLPAEYTGGQYGAFLDAPFNGTVPASQVNMIMTPPDGHTRTDSGSINGAGDYYLHTTNNRDSLLVVDAPLAGQAAQAGERLKLSFDYFNTDNDSPTRTEVRLYGMNDMNQARTPFFGWVESSDDSLTDATVLPGPDILTAWGDNTDGQLLEFYEPAPTGTADNWTEFSQSFILPTPDAARGVDGFDYIGMKLYGFNGFVGFDNLSLMWTQQGDANEDGEVNGLDASTLLANFGTTTGALWTDGDFNADGAVNGLDASALLANFGAGAGLPLTAQLQALAVPEPGTLTCLGFAGLALLKRRKESISN